MEHKAQWIWRRKQAVDESEYLLFRKSVVYSRPPIKAEITVTADSCFVLYINGERLLRGPTKSDLSLRYTDTVDLAPHLRQGENVLAAEVIHYPGNRHLANEFKAGPTALMSSMQGGLMIDGDPAWRTDASYHCLPLEAYRFTSVADTDLIYMGHFEDVDGALYPAGWKEAGYREENWKPAVEITENSPYIMGGLANVWQVEPNPIPRPYEEKVSLQRVTRCSASAASQAQHLLAGEWLELPAGEDAWIELDAGEYRTAFPEWEIEGGRGAEICLIYAESYGFDRDGKYIKAARDDCSREGSYLKGGRDVYRPDGRRQNYCPFHYRAFRFIRVEIHGGGQAVKIRLKAVWQTGYPLAVQSRFHSDAGWMDRIWEVSLRTLKSCMYDTYMDCPYYERMQYLMDTRLEALYGFAVSRDDRLARKALRDFYNVQLPNGLLPCHSPANILQIIPTFTFYWIMMLHDHYRYFGDKRLIEGYYPGVEKALAYFTDRLNGQRLLADTGFWQFVDWTADWERGVPVKSTDEINVIHTLMLVFALRQGAELAEVIGRSDCAGHYWQLAEEIGGAVNRYAYDEVRGLYTDTVGRPQWSQHAQVWAVLSGVAEGERARTILQAAMENPDAAKCSFCMQYFLFRALEKAGLYALTRKQWLLWEQMLEMGVTTWPEDPVNWRSDCHAWSAVPLQELMSCGVGLRPAEPGFARVHIAPRMYWLGSCEGSCMTPYGRVTASWRVTDGCLTVQAETEQPVPVLWELLPGQKYEETVSGRASRTVLLEEQRPAAAVIFD